MFDENGKEPIGSASGFFIDDSGIAVTNFHVIRGIYSAAITMTDGSKHKVEKVIGYDEEKDIAILKIEGSGFDALRLGDSDKIVSGEKVYAIGSPKGLENTISEGIISSTSREINGQKMIQITTPISDGSSGGALFNSKCQVIGITTGGISDGQNLNLAVPINTMKSVEQNLSKTIEEVQRECGYIGTSPIPDKVSDYKDFRGLPDYGSVTTSELLDSESETMDGITVSDFVYKLNFDKLTQYIDYIVSEGYKLQITDNGLKIYVRGRNDPIASLAVDINAYLLHVTVAKN